MTLNEFATEMKSEKPYVKMCVSGFQGSGKTRTAAEIIVGAYADKFLDISKPLLFISSEKKDRFLIPMFEKNKINVLRKYTTLLSDVTAAFDFLGREEVSAVFIDSMTAYHNRTIREYLSKNNKSEMKFRDWGIFNQLWDKNFNRKLVDVPGSVFFTARGADDYQLTEDDDPKKKAAFIKTGIKIKAGKESAFESDLNIWMQTEQEIVDNKPEFFRTAIVISDPSRLLDGKMFKNPTYKDFKPVFEFITKLPTGKKIIDNNEHESFPDLAVIDAPQMPTSISGSKEETKIEPPKQETPKAETKEIKNSKIKPEYLKMLVNARNILNEIPFLEVLEEFKLKRIEDIPDNDTAVTIINNCGAIYKKTVGAN